MSIGRKIKQFRIINKMSQEELADQLNMAQTSISNFESDKFIPDFLVMHKISKIFEVSLDFFIEQEKEFKTKNIAEIDISKNSVIKHNLKEGILEDMLKRIELLESKMK